MDPKAVAAELARELRAAGRPERAAQEQRYLKSELQHLIHHFHIMKGYALDEF